MDADLCPFCGAYWDCGCQAERDREDFRKAIEELSQVGIDYEARRLQLRDRDEYGEPVERE